MPGFGSELHAAMAGSLTKKRGAVLASFAFYGVRAIEWLHEDPQRVVQELLKQQESTQSGRRTRSGQRSTDRKRSGSSDVRSAAYSTLGLQFGASQHDIKKAHRRLAKQHHPDLGGSAENFRKINEAYQLLIA
jgi:DnaJ-domain-containing protein 1